MPNAWLQSIILEDHEEIEAHLEVTLEATSGDVIVDMGTLEEVTGDGITILEAEDVAITWATDNAFFATNMGTGSMNAVTTHSGGRRDPICLDQQMDHHIPHHIRMSSRPSEL